MALSLRVSKDSKIKIGACVLEVVGVPYSHNIVVDVNGKRFHITERERAEVLPNVFVSCGIPSDGSQRPPRLAIEAPRDIRIQRVRSEDDYAEQ